MEKKKCLSCLLQSCVDQLHRLNVRIWGNFLIFNSKQEILDIALLKIVIFISMFSISALIVNEKYFRRAVKTFGLIENYSFTVSATVSC